jgi:hypothetical protein
MIRLLTLSATAICCAACFGFATPTAAKDYEYRRRAITSYMLQCGFDTLSQCQDMSFGRGGDCLRNPSLGSAAGAYAYARGSARPLSTHRFTRNSKKSTPSGLATASMMFRKPLTTRPSKPLNITPNFKRG